MIADADLFITMHIRDEATRSNQIQGTQATLADVVEAEVAHLDIERRDAVVEKGNYIDALNLGLRRRTGAVPPRTTFPSPCDCFARSTPS